MPGKVPREGMKTESVFCTKGGNCEIVEVNTDIHAHLYCLEIKVEG